MAGPLALAGLALPALWLAWSYGFWSAGAPGAGLLPGIGAAIMLLAGLASLRGPAGAQDDPPHRRRIAIYGGGLIAIVPAVAVLGMIPALGLFVALILRLVEGVKGRTAAVVALGGMIGCWTLFDWLLQVPLPKPMFWR